MRFRTLPIASFQISMILLHHSCSAAAKVKLTTGSSWGIVGREGVTVLPATSENGTTETSRDGASNSATDG